MTALQHCQCPTYFCYRRPTFNDVLTDRATNRPNDHTNKHPLRRGYDMNGNKKQFVYKRGSCLYEYIWIMECQQKGGEKGILEDLKSKGLSETSLQREQIRRKNEFNTNLEKKSETSLKVKKRGRWRVVVGGQCCCQCQREGTGKGKNREKLLSDKYERETDKKMFFLSNKVEKK